MPKPAPATHSRPRSYSIPVAPRVWASLRPRRGSRPCPCGGRRPRSRRSRWSRCRTSCRASRSPRARTRSAARSSPARCPASAIGTASAPNAASMTISLRICFPSRGVSCRYFSFRRLTVFGNRKRRCGDLPCSGLGSLTCRQKAAGSSSTAERMRELGYRTVDVLVDWLADDSAAARAARDARRDRGQARASRRQTRASRSRRCSSGSFATCFRTRAAPTTRATSPSCRSRARGPARSATSRRARATSTRARGWSRPARAQVELEVLGWFKEWVGYPGRGRRLARHRRLDREPDRARVRARDARRAR